MNIHNGFNPIKLANGDAYSLKHLGGLRVDIAAFKFEDQRVDSVSVIVRPTNHVYSRAVKENDCLYSFKASGHLLLKYEHHRDDPHAVKLRNGKPDVDSERRIFCQEKYQASKRLPDFITLT